MAKAAPKPYLPKMSQLLTLLDVAKYMGEKRKLDDLLRYIAEQGVEALECDRCSIFLHDRENALIWSRVATGTGEIIQFPEGSGIAGEAIATQQIIKIDNAYDDPRFNGDIDRKTGYRTETILAVPMKNNKGRAIGCFQAINKADGKFTDDDGKFALAFSSQAAVSIESALLHEQNVRMIKELTEAKIRLQEKIHQIEIIHEIESKANEVPVLKEFLEFICQRLGMVLRADAVAITIEWEQGKWLHFVLDNHSASEFSESVLTATPELSELVDSYREIGLVTSADQSRFAQIFRDVGFVTKTRSVIPCTFDKITQDGEALRRRAIIQMMYRNEHVLSEENKSFLSIIGSNISDIVERRLLKETQAQSDRLATIGQLSSTIFHDFKNPMASIRGIAEIIGMGSLEPKKITHFTDIIQTQVDRCCGMIEELLAFTRGESSFDFEDGSFSDFMNKIKAMLEVEAERNNINLEVSCNVSGPIRFDQDKLMRVIFNLTNNAFEILGSGDRLTISASNATNGMIEVVIEDSGPGVPQHLQDTLFEVFVTHGKKNGTGLGLNIARQIVNGHGGDIMLDKNYKDGARFVFTLNPNPSLAA